MPPAGADEFYTRREGDQLARRVEHLDTYGSRGMPALQLQVAELARQVKATRSDISRRLDAHLAGHRDQEQARITGRRWRVTAAWAGIASMTAVLSLLVAIATQLSHLAR